MKLTLLAFAGMALAGAVLPTASKSDVGIEPAKTSDSVAPRKTYNWGATNWTEVYSEGFAHWMKAYLESLEKNKMGGKASPSDAGAAKVENSNGNGPR
ncbi:hypothetical protein FPHYL_10667 [Fusarium phyllophilum]|uniref:Uncharacterized protein n=1 Tax=Fusarium phyllophilum TaxID=47803 RepID=A0A8H5IZS6_9HYPO|nr:hypothetical protein FPHYL_10667 [Fusarium phyllophilum]